MGNESMVEIILTNVPQSEAGSRCFGDGGGITASQTHLLQARGTKNAG